MTTSLSRMTLFKIWVETPQNSKFEALIAYVLQEIREVKNAEVALKSIKSTIRNFCQNVYNKWKKVAKHRQRFLDRNSRWLQGNITFCDDLFKAAPNILRTDCSTIKRGRPTKSFNACSYKTKKLKVQHLLQSTSEELSMATEIQLRKEGKRDSAAIVKELSTASPKRGTTIKKARRSLFEKPALLSPEQALALMVDTNLSTRYYLRIREQAEDVNCKLYPPYYKVKEAKKLCYPLGIIITEISAEISLQSLIDHSVSRLCQIKEVSDKLCLADNTIFNIIIKWGCDGSEQNRYKQKFSEEHFTDESLFSICMVPIQMSCGADASKTIIWKCPVPSSTRYCRPIKFVFAKESINLITTEVNKIKQQIETLAPTKVTVNDVDITITSIMIFCMVDGKVCNAVSSCSSTQTCYLCGAKPTEMNKISIISKKAVKKEFLSFGISPLHSWIRLLECILHISYRLGIKTWQVRGIENKKEVSRKKKEVQDRFKRDLGLLIDMPKQQTGNTNDGNTARKFFRNAAKSAEITGVNLELIKCLGIILECINCDEHINLNKFQSFARKTRDLYLQHYGWYPMPVSLHKILFHGRDIIEACILPIGQYSEEAQEARNKHNRQYRELFTRKTSRIHTNTDLLNRLLITSDPFIASLRAPTKTKHKEMNIEILNLLQLENEVSLSVAEAEDTLDESCDSSDVE